MSASEKESTAVWMLLMSLGNWGFMTAVGLLLARSMTPIQFGYYGTVVAWVSVVSIVCNLGMEKLSLRIIPHYHVTGEWSHARGFLRFSPILQVGLSLLAGAVSVLVYLHAIRTGEPRSVAFGVMAIFLPFIVLFGYFIEVATAKGNYLSSTFVYRVLLPLFTLAGVYGAWVYWDGKLSAVIGVICYGLPWVVCLFVMGFLAMGALPKHHRRGLREYFPVRWIKRSLSFLVYSLVLTFLNCSGLLAMSFFHVDKVCTGYFAAATQLTGILIVMATSTSRFYLPRLSTYVDTVASEDITRMFRSRRILNVVMYVAYMAFVLFLGRPILQLYGEGYVQAWIPWIILAVGDFFALQYSLSAAYLQYHHHDREVYLVLLVSLGFTVASVFPLTAFYGIYGAAIGDALSTAVLFLWMFRREHRLRKEILEKAHLSGLLLKW